MTTYYLIRLTLAFLVFLPLVVTSAPPAWLGVSYSYGCDPGVDCIWQPAQAAGTNSVYMSRWDWALTWGDAPPGFSVVYGIPLRKSCDELYYPADFPDLPAFLVTHKHAWWALGNEPNATPVMWCDDAAISAAQYADWVHAWAAYLRSHGVTRLAMAGLAPAPTNYAMRVWFEQFIQYYRATYGPLPFSAYDVHLYVHNPYNTLSVYTWVKNVYRLGGELWVSEFGVLWDQPTEDVIRRMDLCIKAMRYYGVNRAWWFTGYNGESRSWQSSELWDAGGNLMPLGHAFRERVH